MESHVITGMKPARLSALHGKHVSMGAAIEDHHGWRVAARFATPEVEAARVREGAGLADVSWMGKIAIKGRGAENEKWSMENGTAWTLAKEHWLVTCAAEHREAVLEAARRAAAAHPCLRVTDVTSAFAALLLAGPRSRDVLRALTALDVSARAMPDRTCAQTGLAHVHAILLRQDLGPVPAFRVLVDRAYGEYVWDAVMHAGHRHGIVPVGLTASKRMENG